jgi:hypothetical protein
MAVVQFGVFEEFKGQTTLLVWSDGAGMAELATQFRGMADGRVSTVEFGKLQWAHSGQSTEVTLRVVPPGCEGENLSRIGDKWLVEWRGLAAKFSEAADLLEALVPEQYAAGHQYLDTVTFQFMVSKGEYPPDFAKKTCEPGRD